MHYSAPCNAAVLSSQSDTLGPAMRKLPVRGLYLGKQR